MALCPDVASLTVNQFDCFNLLWRSVIRYGERETTRGREVTTGGVLIQLELIGCWHAQRVIAESW